MKAPSPLLGFNNNVRHKGRVFHIQTEDSGIRHPHIITHLFADGGRILKTTKTSYAEHIGQPTLAETVRGMMQDQHKGMFIALRDGQFDHLFEDSSSGPQSSRGKAAKPAITAREQAATAPALDAVQPPRAETAPVAQTVETSPTSPRHVASRPKIEIDPGLIHGHDASLGPSSSPTVEIAVEEASPPPPPVVAMPNRIRSEPSIDLDLDALERAAAEAQTPIFQQIQDLPPPPAAVLGKRGSAGGYSVRSPEGPRVQSPERGGIRRPSPAAPIATSAQPARPAYAPPQQPAGRYAPSRPAAIFATSRPSEGASIFGEDLISEKSLDEVILSYLAEDLENPPDKK